MSNYYYLDIKLVLQIVEEVTPAFFKKNIVQAVKQLFGVVGAAPDIDILKFNPVTLEAIIRVPKSHYIKVRGSLTLCGKYEGQPCVYLMGLNGKDLVIFATKEDHSVPSKIALPPPDPQPGLILANGEINWNCPCLGGMATGPCGVEFRNAFSCFHHSNADPKDGGYTPWLNIFHGLLLATLVIQFFTASHYDESFPRYSTLHPYPVPGGQLRMDTSHISGTVILHFSEKSLIGKVAERSCWKLFSQIAVGSATAMANYKRDLFFTNLPLKGGSDCLDKFKTMQTCMQKFPTLYNRELTDEEEMSSMAEAEHTASAGSDSHHTSDSSNK